MVASSAAVRSAWLAGTVAGASALSSAFLAPRARLHLLVDFLEASLGGGEDGPGLGTCLGGDVRSFAYAWRSSLLASAISSGLPFLWASAACRLVVSYRRIAARNAPTRSSARATSTTFSASATFMISFIRASCVSRAWIRASMSGKKYDSSSLTGGPPLARRA